ncbi:hypothetical protein CF66_2401 [Candidatus Photodesmus katoptron]|uniref:FixH n=1 Tax=Candidatus Photodesmus katoptron Akat1 TaxID=1236703 RepID=S3E055_9GAMM|nr:FixH family protein [Candidatus Photodesmus katoptron]EPE37591.1 hypothetical protein O1U_0045 [Candidatus Photodesmus katoptron Akat1]KEY90692.1 hypothetical protein CF66_2401 [Candidatus Photodesmus katoptron]
MLKPWYKQFWPCFLIALPLLVIIASIITILIFSKNSINLISKDYYIKGKSTNINLYLSRINVARKLKINAYIFFDKKNIIIRLDKGKLEHYPDINTIFTHRTSAGYDFSYQVLSKGNNQYHIPINRNMIEGPWFIKISPNNKRWLIEGKVTFPSSEIQSIC